MATSKSNRPPTYRVISVDTELGDPVGGVHHYVGDSSSAAMAAHEKHPGSWIYQRCKIMVPVTYDDGTRHLHSLREAQEMQSI
jgi:hypothetical protein